MATVLEEITKVAMLLPIRERLALANQLIDSAESQEAHGESPAAWESEIQNRIRAIDAGYVVGYSFEDVQKEVAQLLAQ
jgi:putative addiction module component (TIGR02574 family)